MNEYERLKKLAAEKASAAMVLVTGDSPDIEKSNELFEEAKALDARAEAWKAAKSLVDANAKSLADHAAAKAEPPVNAGLAQVKVTKDEADKKIEAGPPYKTMGEFLLDVVHFQDDPAARTKLRVLRSADPTDEHGFNVGKAIGYGHIGSLTDARRQAWKAQAARKAISGMSELVPADGGLLVQTDQNLNILSRMYGTGELLQRVSMMGISANSNSMALYGEDETSRVDGSRRGGIQAFWASEGDEKSGSKPKFRKILFNLEKLIGLVYATDELMQDAGALESWIMQHLPEELRFKAEDGIIRGTGAGQPQGIIGAPGTVNVAIEVGQAADTVVSENIVKMRARRWARANDYVWLVNQDVTPQLHLLNLPVGTGGALVYMPPGGLSQSPYGSLYGRPVIETEYCSTVGTEGDIILFSPSQYQMIEKGGIQSAVSMHVRFIYDEQVFRFVYRVDGKPLWHSPLTPYQGTNTQSAFVTLDDRD